MSLFLPKHYKALADLVKRAKEQDAVDQEGGLDMLQRMLAETLADDNPKFNRDKFDEACAYDGGEQ